MKKMHAALADELNAGRPAVLCSIVSSLGSTPRETGAKMLVLADGRTLGTIGGGAVEYRAIRRAEELLREGRSDSETYDLSGGGDAGMICGGSVEVLFQFIAPGSIQALDAWKADTADRVFLFGAGHVAQALVPVLTLADFSVAVWDDRNDAPCPAEACAMHRGPYEEALARLGPIEEGDYIVIMTHGHLADYEVLSQALRTPAKYIGCIGSQGKAAAIRERLLAAGFTQAEVSRIHSPIGLPIGGKSPGEIAVSVAAQLIACRSGRLGEFR